jgi:2-methylcitrate dehydratase PrpD
MSSLHEWLVDVACSPFTAPRSSRDAATIATRDLVSVAVLGSTADTVRRVGEYVDVVGAAGVAVVLGSVRRTDPVSAALLNGSAAQAYDFDDIAPSCVSHVSAVMVPAIVSLLDELDPERAMSAMVLGLGVIDRLAEVFTHEVYDRGLQPTHTVGPVGAAVALIHALGLDRREATAALGLLATQIIGLRAHTGTSYKPVQAGIVASAVVRSVLLARRGIDAGRDAIDVVLALIGVRPEQLARLTRADGLMAVPLAPKWYPTCGAAHTAIEATLQLRDELGPVHRSDDVRIEVTSPPRVMNALEFGRPRNPDEARFSMTYCVARAWESGTVAPEHFTTAALADPAVMARMDAVVIERDDALTPPPTWSGFPAVVSARNADGTVLGTRRVDRPLGYPERPLSEEQLCEKFLRCTTGVLGEQRAAEAFDRLSPNGRGLADLDTILRPA